VVNTRRFLSTHPDRATPGLRALVEQLSVILDRAGRVADQAGTRVGGEQPASATRLVSMHDPHARPIAKGRLCKPGEFGYYAASRVMPRERCA
jgi:IS5 family transposase